MSVTTDTFVVLDFDRTLGDTDKLFAALGNLLGGRDTVDWQVVKREFVALGDTTDFLMPGARELLAYLRQMAIGHGILTYGGREWQEMKLAAARLSDMPTIITSEAKGPLLKRWQQPDGRYALPPEFAMVEYREAQHIIFVDDKPTSFDGAPTSGMTKILIGSALSGEKVLRADTAYDALALIQQQF